MAYKFYELFNRGGRYSDVIIANSESPDLNCFVHYAYAMPSADRPEGVPGKRGIPLREFCDWKNNQSAAQVVTNGPYYFPGRSALKGDKNPNTQVDTVMRLGALELLANISSGRIAATDKDPFPHQLALQQFMENNQQRITRLLIADEVGLGKTIEAGLILRDRIIKNPDTSCLYLTRGGLREDVCDKLRSVLGRGNHIGRIEKFTDYGSQGDNVIRGSVYVGSLDAAIRHVDNKERLSRYLVAPEIIIIDECHYCSAAGENIDLNNNAGVTQRYRAAFQLMMGHFWPNSNSPRLVILMSATPFRSAHQFVNLLRLLSHNTEGVGDAYANNIGRETLAQHITTQDSEIAVVWRQQDQVRNWQDQRFFPNLAIVRPHQELDNEIKLEPASEDYIKLLARIKDYIVRVHKNHGRGFGGFAVRQLEQKLTSSSISGGCWIFRWCVQHAPWSTRQSYTDDQSEAVKAIRELLRTISRSLRKFNDGATAEYTSVKFVSDRFDFFAAHLRDGNIPEVFNYKRGLSDEDDDVFVASPEELLGMAKLGLELLNFSSQNDGVENTKLNWLRAMLDRHGTDKFLVFTESLQTCEVIKAAIGDKICGVLIGGQPLAEREEITEQFCNVDSGMRVLVATSAADEGFDFQVANRIVHWDLHPSPATLMQRNGRLARLGQVSDVTAYYLIVQGTHEERRERALLERFTALGIQDEVMRLKILGQLSPDQEQALSQAIEGNDLGMVDQLLGSARRIDEEMRKCFEEVNYELACKYVIDRDALEVRLKRWKELGLPDSINIDIEFGDVEWERPIFGVEKTTSELVRTPTVLLKEDDGMESYKLGSKFVFDPGFKVFGGTHQRNTRMAGLHPWVKRARVNGDRTLTKCRPLDKHTDPLGYLAFKISRLPRADLAIIQREDLERDGSFKNLRGASYLLVVSRPLKEIERDGDDDSGYLSYYVFDSGLGALCDRSASADEMHRLIQFMESRVSDQIDVYDKLNKFDCEKVGKELENWLHQKLKFPGLVERRYFMPIPVALIYIVD
ncbi:MAG: DEAD/DEAH box helicase [Pseudomonadota bacterium]